MAFVYTEWMRNLVGPDVYPGLPNFEEPRSIAQLRKPLERCTVGILTSAGVQLASDPLLETHNDLSYRTIPRSARFEDLIVRHSSPSRKWAEQDLNVVYPRDPLMELENEGFIGRVADTAVSIVGSIQLFRDLMLETAPKIADEFRGQGVDLVLMVPL
jgi:D-proline reductase (dithiol) PrdB